MHIKYHSFGKSVKLYGKSVFDILQKYAIINMGD